MLHSMCTPRLTSLERKSCSDNFVMSMPSIRILPSLGSTNRKNYVNNTISSGYRLAMPYNSRSSPVSVECNQLTPISWAIQESTHRFAASCPPQQPDLFPRPQLERHTVQYWIKLWRVSHNQVLYRDERIVFRARGPVRRRFWSIYSSGLLWQIEISIARSVTFLFLK
jgi:hypothetical protein